MAVVPCPSCNDLVRLPAAGLPARANVQCPWCSVTLPAPHWSRRLPPMAIVHEPADGQHEPSGPNPSVSSSSHHDILPTASPGDLAADPDETVGDLKALTLAQAKTTLMEDELNALSDPPNSETIHSKSNQIILRVLPKLQRLKRLRP
mgnify:CR=1 FL=1